MNAYFFTGWISQFLRGHLVDSCSNLVVRGADSEEAARHFFEHCLSHPNTAEDPTPTKVEKVVGACLLDQLLTESGSRPLAWEEITAEAQKDWEGAEMDESELGYWVDCNQCLDPEKLPPDIDSLRRELPEDLQSGLNWAPDKNRFFLVSILRLPPPPNPEAWEEETEANGHGLPDEEREDVGNVDLVERQGAFPELTEKETTMLVRARNSVIAAWLCRKAASSNLARNPIRIDAWCGVAPYQEPAAQ